MLTVGTFTSVFENNKLNKSHNSGTGTVEIQEAQKTTDPTDPDPEHCSYRNFSVYERWGNG
jgi:hypothetical protein